MFYRYRTFRKNLRNTGKEIRQNSVNYLKEPNLMDAAFYEDTSLFFKFIACAVLFLYSLFSGTSMLKFAMSMGLVRQGTELRMLIADETLHYYFALPLAIIFILAFIIMYTVMHMRVRQAGGSIARNIFSFLFLGIGIGAYVYLKPERIKIEDPFLKEYIKPEYIPIIAIVLGLLFLLFSVNVLTSVSENKEYKRKMFAIDWFTLVRMPLILFAVENLAILLWGLTQLYTNVMPVVIGIIILGAVLLVVGPVTLSSGGSESQSRKADKLRKEADYYDKRSTQHGTIGNAFGRDQDDRDVAAKLRREADALDKRR